MAIEYVCDQCYTRGRKEFDYALSIYSEVREGDFFTGPHAHPIFCSADCMRQFLLDAKKMARLGEELASRTQPVDAKHEFEATNGVLR